MTVEKFISVKLEGKSIVQVTTDILNLMTGSINLVGSGGVIGSNYRDLDIEANSSKELDTFLSLLANKGYSIS